MSFLYCAAPVLALVAGGLCQAATAQTSLVHRPGQPLQSAMPAKNRTVSDPAEAVAAATATPTTGKFVANFTIKLVTAVPSGYEVLCELTASTFEENTSTGTINNEIIEEADSKATVSGSTATCSPSIPYSWYLVTPSSDTVALSYYLYIISASATSQAGEARQSSQYVPGAGSIKVPANGATTTYTISATL